MSKVKEWEEKYKNYNKADADKKIEELEIKLNNKTISKEEYDQLKVEKRVRENIDKVENLLELRGKLEQSRQEIRNEIKRLDDLSKANEKSIKIEEELGKLSEKRTKVNAELKNIKAEKEKLTKQLENPSLKDDERAEINEKIAKLDEDGKKKKDDLEAEQQKNDQKYLENQKVYKENMKGNEKFSGKTVEELKKESFEIGSKISKINMVANNLMQGKSWNTIEIALDNWKERKFESKEKVTEKVKEDGKVTSSKEDRSGDEEETSLVKRSEFLSKHPRLAKIVNWFSNVKDKITNIRKDTKGEERSSEEDDKKTEVATEANDFKKYLKEVAEKGMEQVKLEEKFGPEKAQEMLETRKKREERKANGGFKAMDQQVDDLQKENLEEIKEKYDEGR